MLKRILALSILILGATAAFADQQLYLNTSMTNGPSCTRVGIVATLKAQWDASVFDPQCTLHSSYTGTGCGLEFPHVYVIQIRAIKGCHCESHYEAVGSVIVSACGGTVKTPTFYRSFYQCDQDPN